MHYYQFHIGDYRKDTAHLIPIEHYIYRSLIDWYFLDEKPIPKITQSVIRRLMLGSEYIVNVENVLSDFFVLSDDGYRHKRIDKEIEEYHGKCVKNKDNGIKGGRPKKTQSVILNNPDVTQNNPTVTLTINQEPLTNNHKPTKKTLPEYSDEFELAWAAYPSRPGANKKESFKAWNARVKSGADKNAMIEGAIRYASYCKTLGIDPQFIKQPSTFFGPGDHYSSDWRAASPQRKIPSQDNFETKDYGTGVNPL
ncbi:MAG: YdaU family protein [Methylococcaceae bacterium]|jgi:uncharacterized protein YdaU (DUF1376 family)